MKTKDAKDTAKASTTKKNPAFEENLKKAEALTVEKVLKAKPKMTEEEAKNAISGAQHRAKEELKYANKYGMGSGYKTASGDDGECDLVPGTLRSMEFKAEETGKVSTKNVMDIKCRRYGDVRTVATSDLHQVKGLGLKAKEEDAKARRKGRGSKRKSAAAKLEAAAALKDILS